MSKETFKAALAAWVQAVVAGAAGGDFTAQPRDEWVQDQENANTFFTASRPVIEWGIKYVLASYDLPEWERVLAETQTWAALDKHRKEAFGSLLGGGLVFTDPKYILRPFWPPPTVGDGDRIVVAFNQNAFDEKFERFASFIESPTYAYKTTAIIEGLRMAPDMLPFRIGPDIVIDRLSAAEVKHFGDQGMLRSPMGPRGPYENPEMPWLALHWNRVFPKLTAEQHAKAKHHQASEEADLVFRSTLSALALTRYGTVALGATSTALRTWTAGGVQFTYTQAPNDPASFHSRTLTLQQEDLPVVERLFPVLRSQSVDESVAISIHRLMLAMENKRDEDRLLDGMMAAEAVMGEQTEISFKIALRLAFYLHPNDPRTRRTAFDTMYDAYDVRSKLVHGQKPSPKRMTIRGERVPLAQFVPHVEDMIRLAIRKMVDEGGKKPDWNDLIVGKVPAQADATLPVQA